MSIFMEFGESSKLGFTTSQFEPPVHHYNLQLNTTSTHFIVIL